MANIDDLLGAADPNDGDASSFAIGDAPVEIKVVIGTAMLRVRDLLKLSWNSTVI